ncbi:MAG TPA: GNAT family protein [Flavisolibacter sp.]|jgi:RimJ/RimL family protein N-acetyltransferase|nr:GNAT family protein [Flavisolibacter sp.]
MQLQTSRLILADLSPLDLTDIHQLHSLPETDEFNTLGIPDSVHTTETILQVWLEEQQGNPRMSYIFAIRLAETQHFVGLIALNLGAANFKRGEVWYKLHPTFWRQGFAGEALRRVLQFAFTEIGLHRVEAGCAVENTASIKLLESVGMVREGRKRKVLPVRGQWLDNYFYAILESDFHHTS